MSSVYWSNPPLSAYDYLRILSVPLRGESHANWEAVHAAFERQGLEYQKYRMGARIVDLDSPEVVKASQVDRQLSLGAMSKRFGEFAGSAATLERNAAREAVQHAEQLVLGAQLIADPSPLLERLTANNATFTLRTAEKLVHEKLHAPSSGSRCLRRSSVPALSFAMSMVGRD